MQENQFCLAPQENSLKHFGDPWKLQILKEKPRGKQVSLQKFDAIWKSKLHKTFLKSVFWQ